MLVLVGGRVAGWLGRGLTSGDASSSLAALAARSRPRGSKPWKTSSLASFLSLSLAPSLAAPPGAAADPSPATEAGAALPDDVDEAPPLRPRASRMRSIAAVRWFAGLVRWFVGWAAWRIGGLVDWRIGGLVD